MVVPNGGSKLQIHQDWDMSSITFSTICLSRGSLYSGIIYSDVPCTTYKGMDRYIIFADRFYYGYYLF